MAKTVTGWWFTTDKTLPHGDGHMIRIGSTYKVNGKIVLCRNGLCLYKRPVDALKFASGSIVYKVRGSGIIVEDYDTFACSERTYLAGGINVPKPLRHFARLCALDVVPLWDAPEVVVRYLKTGDESIRHAAWYTTRTVARPAAARDARAAWTAAWAATEGDAWYAAEAAARAVRAVRAAKDKQNRRLTRMLNKAIREDRP